MALNDLTPKLRTRMNQTERRVGFFVITASILVLIAISYYAYSSAVRKGWTRKKVPYFTLVSSADGLKVGDSVMLMGFKAGVITSVLPNDPGEYYNVTVRFEIWEPYYGYLWTDSEVQLKSSLLGGKILEVTKGGQSGRTDGLSATYQEKDGRFYMWIDPTGDEPEGHWSERPIRRKDIGYLLVCYEGDDVMSSANNLVTQISDQLPGVFSLTNQVIDLFEESTKLLIHLSDSIEKTYPIVENLQTISTMLTNAEGSLGEWVIPSEMNKEIIQTIGSVRGTVNTTETNIATISQSINESLINLADITANLREQVQANSYILSSVSKLVLDLDDMVQGLKRNWLLKGSFSPQTNAIPESLLEPSFGGRPQK